MNITKWSDYKYSSILFIHREGQDGMFVIIRQMDEGYDIELSWIGGQISSTYRSLKTIDEAKTKAKELVEGWLSKFADNARVLAGSLKEA